MVDSSASSRMTETTFVLAYPCHHTHGSVGRIVSAFENWGFKSQMGCMHVNKAFALEHVDSIGLNPDAHDAKIPYGNLVTYLASECVVAMTVEGNGAINKVLALISSKQPPFWSTNKGIPTVYASSTECQAKKDIERWFQDVDLKEMEHSKKVVSVLPDKLHGPWKKVQKATSQKGINKDCLDGVHADLKDYFRMEHMCVFLIKPLAFERKCVGEILEAIENNCACIRGMKLVKKEDCPSKLWTSEAPCGRGVAVVGYLVKQALKITSEKPTVKHIDNSERVFEIGSDYVQQSGSG